MDGTARNWISNTVIHKIPSSAPAILFTSNPSSLSQSEFPFSVLLIQDTTAQRSNQNPTTTQQWPAFHHPTSQSDALAAKMTPLATPAAEAITRNLSRLSSMPSASRWPHRQVRRDLVSILALITAYVAGLTALATLNRSTSTATLLDSLDTLLFRRCSVIRS